MVSLARPGPSGWPTQFDGVDDYRRAELAIARHRRNRPDNANVDQAAAFQENSAVLSESWGATMTSPFYQYGLELVGGTVPNLLIGTSSGPRVASMETASPPSVERPRDHVQRRACSSTSTARW